MVFLYIQCLLQRETAGEYLQPIFAPALGFLRLNNLAKGAKPHGGCASIL